MLGAELQVKCKNSTHQGCAISSEVDARLLIHMIGSSFVNSPASLLEFPLQDTIIAIPNVGGHIRLVCR